MSFRDTGLHWLPPSDHLPEADSPGYYSITGVLGEMGVSLPALEPPALFIMFWHPGSTENSWRID